MSAPAHPLEDAQGGAVIAGVHARSLDCVHCGLCLPACPTYRITGRETSSPRGRVALMRGVAEGRLPLGAAVADELFLCLGCRACETACPSGVRFGEMLEDMRAETQRAGLRRGAGARLERWLLRHVVPRRRRLRLAVDLVGIAQRTGLPRRLPGRLGDLFARAPRIALRRERRPLPSIFPAQGPLRGRVGLFTGCVMSELFAPVNEAAARVLATNGFEVVVAAGQTCCGALHAHAGDGGFARALARRNVAAFGAADLDAVVSTSAGCGAALREADRWLGGEGARLAERARDVCELLDAAGLRPPSGRIDARVCYDDPCHLIHGQRIEHAPRRLLAQIPGLMLVAHDDPGSCCGAAGTYSLTHPQMAGEVLERKLRALEAAQPDFIASGNPGCLLQLGAGAARRGLRARVVHPIELLDAAYR